MNPVTHFKNTERKGVRGHRSAGCTQSVLKGQSENTAPDPNPVRFLSTGIRVGRIICSFMKTANAYTGMPPAQAGYPLISGALLRPRQSVNLQHSFQQLRRLSAEVIKSWHISCNQFIGQYHLPLCSFWTQNITCLKCQIPFILSLPLTCYGYDNFQIPHFRYCITCCRGRTMKQS